MAYGIQLLNTANRVQVDESSKVPRLLSSGYSPLLTGYGGLNYSETTVTVPINVDQEIVLCMVQPTQSNKFVGYNVVGHPLSITGPYGTSGGNSQQIYLGGECAFYWAVFGYTSTPISDASAYGLEIYNNTGGIIYSSKHQHPRISQMVYMPANTNQATRWGYPYTSSISGFSSMPWLVTTPYIRSPTYSEGIDSLAGIMGAINSNFTQITIDIREVVNGYGYGFPTLNLSQWSSSYPGTNALSGLNPYYGISAYFPVATYA